MQNTRSQTWSSQLSYILTLAGATIGFGATWRFPYLVGENGGGAYVFLFVIAMIVIGIPMILVESVIGRRMHKNSIDSFTGEKSSPKWKILGYMGLIGNFLIIAYYMVLGGWVMSYIYGIITGDLSLSAPINKDVSTAFYNLYIENNPFRIGLFTFIFVVINYIILSFGVINGIEKAMKVLMPLLLFFMLAMVVRNVTLPGAMEGIRFYLYPDFSKINLKLFILVLGQVFFALSLGFGVMITLSSFVNKSENLLKTSIITSVVNTIIAILAGFMIFPSLFSFGLAPDSGPSLVFKTLPIVFSYMHFGGVFAVIFFSLLLVAALTTSITLYEVPITAVEEKLKIGRKKAIMLVLLLFFVVGNIPSILSYGSWSEIRILGRNIFDFFDYTSGNIFFVLTALGTCIFVGWSLKDEAKQELNNGLNSPKIINTWFFYIKYIIPIVILLIFVNGI